MASQPVTATMDPFLDFDAHNDPPVDLIDYLTAAAVKSQEDAAGEHWTRQDEGEGATLRGMGTASYASANGVSPTLLNSTPVQQQQQGFSSVRSPSSTLFSYTTSPSSSATLATSLGFHLGSGDLGSSASVDGMDDMAGASGDLSDETLARLLFAPSDPFVSSDGGNQELAAAYAAFAQDGTMDLGQPCAETAGTTPADVQMLLMQARQQAWIQQQMLQPGMFSDPSLSSAYHDRHGQPMYFGHNIQQSALTGAQQQQQRHSGNDMFPFSTFPANDSSDMGTGLGNTLSPLSDAQSRRYSHSQPEYNSHSQTHSHSLSPASASASGGTHSTSPTASHGAVSASLHPSTHPSSSSLSSSSSSSRAHEAALKPFVVGEGMTMAPQLLNVHMPMSALGNGTDSNGGNMAMQDRRESVNTVATSSHSPSALTTTVAGATEKNPGVKLHNKVEKRYRYNVKNALETLRDAVPRLRQVYKTSLPIEIATTDREDEDGLMGGLERLGKPTKKTVMYGARLYIEHLETEQRIAEVRVKRGEEALRGCLRTEEWTRWKIETENQVLQVKQQYTSLLEDKARIRAEAAGLDGAAAAVAKGKVKTEEREEEDDEDEEEDDEEATGDARPKKRTRKAAAGALVVPDPGKPAVGRPRKDALATTTTTGKRKARGSGTGMSTTTATAVSASASAAFYSFGLAYMVFPRATSLFGSTASSPYAANTSSGHSGNGARNSGGKVLLASASHAAAAKSAEMLGRALPAERAPHPDTILDTVWFVLLGLALTGFALWIARRRSLTERRNQALVDDGEDDEPVHVDKDGETGGGQEEWERLGFRLGVGTVSGLIEEVAARIPLVGRPVRMSHGWYKLLSAFVGGDVNIGWLGKLHLRLRLARAATDSESFALLYAVACKNDAERKSAWSVARKLAIDSNVRAIQDVSALSPRHAHVLLEQISPTTTPIEGIANQLVLEELDRIFTQIYVCLVTASYPDQSSGTQLRMLVDNLTRSSVISSLADSAFKTRIQSVLTGVERDSEAHTLGLVLIGLWGYVVGQEPVRQRALANMLIAQQIRQTDRSAIGALSSVDLVLGLILPGYRNPAAAASKPDHRTRGKPTISNMAQELDTIAAVCLRYLLLLRSVPLLAKSDATRQERQRSSLYVRQACLEIRVLLARPAFDALPEFETNQRSVIAAKDIQVLGIHSHPYSGVDRLESDGTGRETDEQAEHVEFSRQTDRLIDLMTVVGYRAAGRAAGRDDDSGVEGDLDEL
ncbi:hypothetical protein QFC19_008980 [Naganishia cerealis]|uniref:Uncharacterized protein n=1 Tax=Naganishia cerealis TaxID=610337 RepID=A0ACC2UX90_9TREE|nr:hypothetical protein QFC19_008980 [Naganishia cerealis]